MKKFVNYCLCLLPFFGFADQVFGFAAQEKMEDKTRIHPYIFLGIGASSVGKTELNPNPGGGIGIYFTKKNYFVDFSFYFHRSTYSFQQKQIKILSLPRMVYGIYRNNFYFGMGLSWMNMELSKKIPKPNEDDWEDEIKRKLKTFNGIAVCGTLGYNFARDKKFTNSIELNIDQPIARTHGNSFPIFATLYWKVGF